MISHSLKKIINVFRYLSYFLIVFLIKLKPQNIQSRTLLLIRLDSIGDYILFRNFIESVHKSEKYKNYRISICGNIIWQDLAETFDKSIVAEFIWLDREKYYWNPIYVFKLLKHIYNAGFEVAINSTFSRENLVDDAIVNISRAKERVGSSGAKDSSPEWKRKLLTNKYYTKLITSTETVMFEFIRNQNFIESVIAEKIAIQKPSIDCSYISISIPTKNYAVVFPGAQEQKRRWSVEKFRLVMNHLINVIGLDIIIAGSSNDSEISHKLLVGHNSSCYDFTGKTTLPQLAKLISLSKILISNETSAVHFAASVNTPFVCISNSKHFGRFNPYPLEMGVKGIHIYPDEVVQIKDQTEMLAQKFQFDSDLDIDSISAKQVINAIDLLLM